MPTTSVKILRCGNSAAVVLPADWRKRNGLTFGDELELSYDDDGPISIWKAASGAPDKREAASNLAAFIETLPAIPWDDDSPDADRDVLEERYA